MDWYDVRHPWAATWNFRHPVQWTEGSGYLRQMRGKKLLAHQRLYKWYTCRRWNKHFFMNEHQHVSFKATGECAECRPS